jgi:hypothetical protein
MIIRIASFQAFARSTGMPLLAETSVDLIGERRSYLYFVL